MRVETERLRSKPCEVCGARTWMYVQWGGRRPAFVRLLAEHVSDSEHRADLRLADAAPVEEDMDRPPRQP